MFDLFYTKKKKDEKEEEVIYVDRNTHIEGDIRTNKLIVEGTITGTIWADNVVMKKGSSIKGEVFTSSLLLDDDIKCDCEFHIDKDFTTSGDPMNILQGKSEEKQVAAVA